MNTTPAARAEWFARITQITNDPQEREYLIAGIADEISAMVRDKGKTLESAARAVEADYPELLVDDALMFLAESIVNDRRYLRKRRFAG